MASKVIETRGGATGDDCSLHVATLPSSKVKVAVESGPRFQIAFTMTCSE